MKYPKKLQEKYNRLTERQKRFVDLWNGKGKETAKLAGYKQPQYAAVRCLKIVNICQLINFKKDKELKPGILNREQRQKFWSDMMLNSEATRIEQLKASDLLGKSEGDFLLKVDVGNTGDKPFKILIENDLSERIKKNLE